MCGIVESIDIAPGQRVRSGDVVARLTSRDGSELSVTAPTDGEVGEVLAHVGDFVPEGEQVAILVPARRSTVDTFLPVADAKEARVGDEVWVAPTTAAASEFGYARGRVARISDVPISEAGIGHLLENPARVRQIAELGPVIHVVVELLADDTASGLSWTASQGPSEPVTVGTRADVKVVTGERAPIDYVVG
jgi:multidrug efflux pump subunit AcrA (membrane-fusion protein)